LLENFREDWQLANEQMIKFWWRSGSLSGHRDCFPDSSLLGDMESGINWLRHYVTGPQQTATTDVPWWRYALSHVPVLLVNSLSIAFLFSSTAITCCALKLFTIAAIHMVNKDE